jgi:very-short-patch-repair endonuclease
MGPRATVPLPTRSSGPRPAVEVSYTVAELAREVDWLAENGGVGRVVDVEKLPRERPGRDSIIADIATRQYGVVSRAQLLAAGISGGAITTRIRRFGLHPLHRGVYAVGHTALVPLAREMAAVLACGAGAVVSHRSAASSLWHLLDVIDDLIDITIPRSNRRRPGLRVHRSRVLDPEDIRVIRGIPVTSVERTLVDLAEGAPNRDLERALDEAVTRRLMTTASITAAVQRLHGRRGTSRLQALLERNIDPAFTRSEAEERLLALVREAGLPPPAVNGRVGGHTVDFVWRDRRLIVEVDGYRFHSSRTAFERDRVRDAELMSAGFRVIRVTWRQLENEPLTVLARLAQALAV